jgi:hypothetical protein
MKFPPSFACCAATLGCCVLVGGLCSWRVHLLAAGRDLDEKVRAAWAKEAVLVVQRQEADAARVKFSLLTKLEAQLAADRNAPRWAPLLKVLVTSRSTAIQLQRIDVRAKTDEPQAYELRIKGTSAGQSEARSSAELFRRSLAEDLKRHCTPATVVAELTSLDDLPDAPAIGPRCAFTLTADFTPTPHRPD